MKKYDEIQRFLIPQQPSHLQYTPARLQPIQAKPGNPSVNVSRLAEVLQGIATLNETIAVE